jgi:hypothetical protein
MAKPNFLDPFIGLTSSPRQQWLFIRIKKTQHGVSFLPRYFSESQHIKPKVSTSDGTSQQMSSLSWAEPSDFSESQHIKPKVSTSDGTSQQMSSLSWAEPSDFSESQHIKPKVSTSDGTSQQMSSLSWAEPSDFSESQHIKPKVSTSDGTSQQMSSLSWAEPSDFRLELFKPETSKKQAFQAWELYKKSFSSLAKKIWKTSFSNVNPPFETSEQLKDLSWFLFLQLKWFLFLSFKIYFFGFWNIKLFKP